MTECVDFWTKKLSKTEIIEENKVWITNLRDPVDRYLSEFYFLRHGAVWKEKLQCGNEVRNKPGSEFHSGIENCYEKTQTGTSWFNQTLDTFMGCSWNLARNRQVRMLSNLEKCYERFGSNSFEIDEIYLQSAKNNLRTKFNFFGINSEQRLSQWLFEKTFSLEFNEPFQDGKNQSRRKIEISEKFVEDPGIYDIYKFRKPGIPSRKKRYTGKRRPLKHEDVVFITPTNLTRIEKLNQFDVEFFKYAKRLFFARIRYFLTDFE